MSERVLVVQPFEQAFRQWDDSYRGLNAELERLQPGLEADVECVDDPDRLLEIAAAIKDGGELPGRALVFVGVDAASELGQSPFVGAASREYIGQPSDYDADLDAKWAWRGDIGRPLAPYGRLIAARLVRRAVPDVRFQPHIDEDEAFIGSEGFFGYQYAGGGYDELTPSYGAFLGAVNLHAAATGAEFMTVIDAMGQPRADGRNSTMVVDGADIDARWERETDLAVRPDDGDHYLAGGRRVHYIGVTARVLAGLEPDTADYNAIPGLIIPRVEAA